MNAGQPMFTWAPDEEFAATAGLGSASPDPGPAKVRVRADEEMASQLFD